MGKYIKYKRITKEFDSDTNIQQFLDELVIDGWEIIKYMEKPKDVNTLGIIVLVGKRKKEI